jgi:tRNA-specific 2-thiouridylase
MVQKSTQTVYVGLSGGVDSSVSAALLLEQGYTVVGVFIRTWQPDFIECTWRDERRDAMRVAAHLGIPFRELDLEKEYKQYVGDYMIEEYRKGRTPNPDIMCNREIKFGAFKKWALENGADYVATGHYAQLFENEGKFELTVSKDADKDQTYFLWTLTQEDFKHMLFPIGHLEKPEVRMLASKYKLPTASKKDSQGICMLGAVDIKDFLREFIDVKPGNVVTESGDVIGMHPGALFFTLGERHGFTITDKASIGEIYYVIAKDVVTNELTVSTNLAASKLSVEKKDILIERTNWISGIFPVGTITARSRYRAALGACTVSLVFESTALVHFENPELTASSGQSIVFYDNGICLGGGIIA